MPLSETFRLTEFSEMVGQKLLVGNNGILVNMILTKSIKSVIFYGPPGCGKTTAARILAKKSKLDFYELNAVQASLSDIKNIADKAEKSPAKSAVLYLDEIQYFNRKQQQALLPFVEFGTLVLIAATTENPYHCCYDALLSRCNILEFKSLTASDITDYIKQTVLPKLKRTNIDDDAVMRIAEHSAGDMRRALNLLELILTQIPSSKQITTSDIRNIMPTLNMSSFDTNSDTHYMLISGLQKSIRGSDPDAAVFYLARLLEGGDILSPCRRLLVIANEDIGLANPQAIPITYACVETAKALGLPEAAKPLTNAVIYLATSPKSNTSETTYNAAVEDIRNGLGTNTYIPKFMKQSCSSEYMYPHDFPNHWCAQQYLPDDIKTHSYYKAGDNDFEQQAKAYWNYVKQRNEW